MKKIINNIPNAITISRIISCTLGAILFSTGNIIPAIGCYVYGALSDAVDGYLARKLNVVSDLGKKLDAISDKLFALSLMAPAMVLGNLFIILPFVFEGIISAINIYSDIRYKNAHTEKIGKMKTIVLFPTIILGLLSTIEPYLYIAFIPCLFASLKLQAKSIEAYIKQLEEYKNNSKIESNIENNVIDNEKNIEKKDINNIEIKKIENVKKNEKTKKLVRKKDLNDRY